MILAAIILVLELIVLKMIASAIACPRACTTPGTALEAGAPDRDW